MKHSLLFIFVLCFGSFLQAQVTYETIHSEKLGTERKVKIRLPRNYERNEEKSYPIVIVMDGDYLFEPVAGVVDYMTYWEDMPEVITVGILQDGMREDDSYADETNGLPYETSVNFFEFVGLELMPWLDENYRTTNFRLAVGHDLTANFNNFWLFKSPTLFQGYISMSPLLSTKMAQRLSKRLPEISKQELFYYLATGTNDIKSMRKGTEELNKLLSNVTNENFHYYYDNFEGATHYSLASRSIPKAFEQIFSIYRPITKEEYNEKILAAGTSPYEYLINKYESIEKLFNIEKTIILNDFEAIFRALEKKEDWEGLYELGNLAIKQYPKTMLGNYYKGIALSKQGEVSKAIRVLRNGYRMEEISSLTKEIMLDLADNLKNGDYSTTLSAIKY